MGDLFAILIRLSLGFGGLYLLRRRLRIGHTVTEVHACIRCRDTGRNPHPRYGVSVAASFNKPHAVAQQLCLRFKCGPESENRLPGWSWVPLALVGLKCLVCFA